MSSPKFFISQLDIDVYRWKGQWALAEARAKKKGQKYRPNGSSYECLVIGESQLNTIMRHYLMNDIHIDNGLANGKAFMPVAESVREAAAGATEGAVNMLKMAIEKSRNDPNANATDHAKFEIQQAHTHMAWAQLQCGRSAEAVTAVQPFDFREAEEVPLDTRPYVKVMLLAGLTVKAMVLHATGKDEEAFAYSTRAVAFFAKHSNTATPTPKRSRHSPHPDVDQWQRWFEASHHFHSLLASKLGHTQVSLAAARVYVHRLRSTPDKFQPLSKIAVLGNYLRLLGGVKWDSPPPLPLAGIPAKQIPNTIASEARTEMRQILPYYETLVTTVLPFPRGEDVKPMEVERHERVQQCYDWHVFVEMYNSEDESLGDIADRHYRLIQSLYRGTKHTFHSMRMLRYMAHTFVSLISLFGDNMPEDEKTEAEAVMESYVFYWDKQLKARLELDKKIQVEVKLERESMGDLSPSAHAATKQPNGIGLETTKKPTEVLENHVEQTAGDSDPTSRAHAAEILAPVADELRGEMHAHAKHDVDEVVVCTTDGDTASVIEALDGERIIDVVGVLFAGVRMLSHNAEGQEAKLKRAVGYAERAVDLLEAHGVSCGNELPSLQHSAYRCLGVACGELSQEVRDTELRSQYREKALKATQKAKDLRPNGWEGLYQRAMQLAEAGELTQATDLVRNSLEHNKTYAPSWNLLALLLGASKEFTQALKVCEIGVKECIAKAESTAIPTDILTVPGAAPGSSVKWSWDAVDLMEKEDLLNLCLTQIALEGQHLGPTVALASVKKTIQLARKLFGPVDSTTENGATGEADEAVEHPIPPPPSDVPPAHPGFLEVPISVGIGSIRSGRSSRRSKGTSVRSKGTAVSATYSSPATGNLGDVYRFRAHDLFVCLWLTASGLYRALGQFDQANGALAEAEKLVATMAQMDSMLRRLPSRLYQEFSMTKTLQEQGKFRRMLASGKDLLRHKKHDGKLVPGELVHDIPTWGPVGANVKRVVADVAFEGALIRQALFDKLNTPPPAPRFERYLTPIEKLEAERVVRKWKQAVKEGVFQSNAPPPSRSPSPMKEPPIVSSGTDSVSRASGNYVRVNGMNGKTPSINSSVSRASGNYLRVNGTAPGMSDSNETIVPAEVDPLTLNSLLDAFSRVTDIDDDHLGARVHLGILYYKKGDISIASHYLERACKSSKARGGGGGKSGQGSWYGGASARWGWDAWRWLGRCYAQRDRNDVAQEAMACAVNLQRVSFPRGLECLKRMVNSDL
ncbi:hypothetical protein DFJ77DRAFT_38624 [Powellomyces hirtus]|nr:hypothetical protein DFJ77DRAFT_38624 [Powellomyces hirtus]